MKTIIATLISFFFSSFSFAAPTTAERLHTINRQIARTQAHVSAQSNDAAKISRALKKAELSISDVGRHLHQLEEESLSKQTELSQLALTLASAETRLQLEQKKFQEQLKTSYALGRGATWKLLLLQKDPATLNRMLVYLDYLQGARLTNLKDIQLLAESVRDERDAKQAALETLEQMKQQQEATREKLSALRTDRQQVLASMSAQLKAEERSLVTLMRDKRGLEGVLKQSLQSTGSLARAGGPAFDRLKGRMPWPVRGKITNGAGNFPSRGRAGGGGVFIAAPPGSPVRAIYGGKVLYADWLQGFGLLLILKHNEEYLSLYAHNDSLYKNKGDIVQAGEMIGKVGTSGGQNKSGLYFEVRYRGHPVNPQHWCRG